MLKYNVVVLVQDTYNLYGIHVAIIDIIMNAKLISHNNYSTVPQ